VDDTNDCWKCIHSLYPLVLELERPIHSEPVDIAEYRLQEATLYRIAQEEGIPA
jgi:hypothetical protein